jgi:anthranilate phosphoribosyltransferase
VRPGRVERTIRDPRDLGLPRCTPESLAGGDAAHNAAGLRAVFAGTDRGPHRDAIVLNAALALEVAGIVADAAAGIEAAAAALDRGDGTRMLERLAVFGSSLSASR